MNNEDNDFIELMSRSERKEYERQRQLENNNQNDDKPLTKKQKKAMLKEDKERAKQEKAEAQKILDETGELKPIVEDVKDETGELTSVGELFIPKEDKDTQVYEELWQEPKKKKNFTTIIGLILIIAYAFYAYLILFTDYIDTMLIIVDSAILAFILLLYCISLLTGFKATNVLCVLNILLFIVFFTFNGLYINDVRQKEEVHVETIKEV